MHPLDITIHQDNSLPESKAEPIIDDAILFHLEIGELRTDKKTTRVPVM
jgi:hypothetical protein